MSASDFWDNKEKAQETVGKLSAVKGVIEPFKSVKAQIEDLGALVELANEDEEAELLLDEADESCDKLAKALDRLELVSYLGGRFDRSNAIVSLHAGSGGTESCDWCDMLFRMYMRYFERKGFHAEVIDQLSGDVAGLKSAVIMVKGDYSYGYLRSEGGVHRLVRISPFDSNKRRHTSFAAVEISPEIDDDIDVEVEEKDLKVDTFRASGAGGQHVNTTDSAVRITHLPSGIVVSCQNERSQHQNRATCMKILKSKLYERQVAEIDEAREKEVGPKEENAWGSQIRSYVLQPYQMVKDLRTGEETSNTSAVLDGDLDDFIEAYLKQSKKKKDK